MLHALANDKAPTLQRIADQRRPGPGRGPEEDLRKPRRGGSGPFAGRGELDRHLAPSEDHEPLLGRDLLYEIDGPLSASRLAREKRHPRGVAPGLGEIEACNLGIEPVRQLDQRPGAVTGAGVSPERAPVSEVLERREAKGDDAVAGRAFQIHHERDPTCVVLVRGVVATRRALLPGHWRPRSARSRLETIVAPWSD